MSHEATTWRRHLGWPGVVIAVVLLILVGAAALVYRAIRVSLEAEHTLHANYLVLDVVTSHLQRQDAGWPRSWEELVETVPQASWAWYEWPRDVDELRQRVEIDFSLATSDVAAMTEDNIQSAMAR